ncbi:MAG: protein kinase domain-containing protein [Acidimicrobiales bacterium]
MASGGMAEVWEARDTVLDRSVAVKILHRHLAEDPEIVARFRAEAKAAARLSHPSIVAIFDTASQDGVEAIIMELIEGLTLREYLDHHGPLTVDNAIDLTVQVADALGAAHAGALVHRDIKPANIMLCPDRRTKVTDFGIAKALESPDATSQGTILGTAKYLAPEQLQDDPIDQRTDIYSLGIVLFEALTNRAPFEAETSTATALARLHQDPPSVRTYDPSIPTEVDSVVTTAMQRDPAKRYQSAAAMSAALKGGGAIDAAPPDPLPVAASPAAAGPDPTVIGEHHATEPVAPATETTKRSRRQEPLFVALLIVGCLALGIGLILTASRSRDFFDRLSDRLTGQDQVSEGGESIEPINQPGPAATTSSQQTDAEGAPTPLPAPTRTSGRQIAQVFDFDPMGDGSERGDLVEHAIDGDPTSMWVSEGYNNRSFGNLKTGLGLVLVLSEQATISELRVRSPTQGWAASVYTSDSPKPSLDQWGDRIDARVDIDGNATFDLRGVRASAVLLWVTDLGDAPPQTRMQVAELELS